MKTLSATSTLTFTKFPIELLSSGNSTLSTGVFFTFSTVLLVYSNCIWLVWDLDIYMEECWSAANSTLTSTMLLSSCISFLSTGVFFMDSTVLVWDLDTCEEEEELEECWSAVPYPMISAAMMGFHFHSAALSKSTPLAFSSVHMAALSRK